MFEQVGKLVTRYRYVVLLAWLVACAALWTSAGRFEQVVVDGEFAYLPDDVPSRLAERAFDRHFGPDEEAGDIVRSNVVLVVRREKDTDNPDGLKERDLAFVDEVIRPRLLEIAEEEGGLADQDEEASDEEEADSGSAESGSADSESGEASPEETPVDAPGSSTTTKSIIADVRTPSDKSIGKLLRSKDGEAALVVVELVTEFLEERNHPLISKIEELVDTITKDPGLREKWGLGGLEITVSGIAVAGRDMRMAQQESGERTETFTILLVVVLLILIYRAPFLALLPLLTVFLSVKVAIGVLALLAEGGVIHLFTGVKVYVVVIMYGAGVDYCLFLIARYKEELDRGASSSEAIEHSIHRVGAALAASASTTMCGIGMMYFADFGKFSQAGIAIPLSLFFVLLAALTFTPAILHVMGRWAFWPRVEQDRLPQRAGWISPTSLASRILESETFTRFWERVARGLEARPATIWLATVACMAPFAVVGFLFFDNLSYGLLSELDEESPSVVGAEAVQRHFPAGTVGPVTVLVRAPGVDFTSRDGKRLVEELTDRIAEEGEQLGVADVRTLSDPLGVGVKMSLAERAIFRHRAPQYFVSGPDPPENSLTRLEVVFEHDPFSRHSIDEFVQFQRRLPELLPEELRGDETELEYLGATASIRDLKVVTDRDQIKIDVIVSLAVFLILVVLLGRRAQGFVTGLVAFHFVWMFVAAGLDISLLDPIFWVVDLLVVLVVVGLRGNASAKSSYLMLSVLFSYFVTLGVTISVFYLLDPEGFAGLDWKVPMFLFTILVAVGQDYNIYFVTRVDEEQERHGPVKGIGVALARTGGIISSCGLIMAGTFSSLLAGTLAGMQQLGFALAFGVLLDTFVVRPVLVPAYLILLHAGRFGALGRFLGAHDAISDTPHAFEEVGTSPENQPRSSPTDAAR